VDAAKDVALGDRAVRAKIVDVQLMHFELYEGLLESYAEHIGMVALVEDCVRALAFGSLRRRKKAKTYPSPQVWQSRDSNGTWGDTL
jgi:hypothetical protein